MRCPECKDWGPTKPAIGHTCCLDAVNREGRAVDSRLSGKAAPAMQQHYTAQVSPHNQEVQSSLAESPECATVQQAGGGGTTSRVLSSPVPAHHHVVPSAGESCHQLVHYRGRGALQEVAPANASEGCSEASRITHNSSHSALEALLDLQRSFTV